MVKIVVKTHNSITNEKAWMKKACNTNGLPPCNSSHPNLRHSAPKPPALPTALHPDINLPIHFSPVLPNHPRYQLRYTRMCGECGRRRSARRFGSAILQFIFPIVKRMLRRGRKTSEFAPFPRRTGKGTAARSGSERAAATVSVRPAARSGPAGGGARCLGQKRAARTAAEDRRQRIGKQGSF